VSDLKLVRVTLEYDNGRITSLEGEDADSWMSAANSACVMSHIHGMPFPDFNWKIENEGEK